MEGLHIVAFPCNQFGKQEPGSHGEIRDFVADYGLKPNEAGSRFHLMAKVSVNGDKTDPVFSRLKECTSSHKIKWNFATIFIVSTSGKESVEILRHDDSSLRKALSRAGIKVAH